MRLSLRRCVWVLATAMPLVAYSACGLDEQGTLGPDATMEAGLAEVSPADIHIPDACKTLNVRACLDADIPDGWAYAAVSLTAATCPSADWAPTTYAANIRPDPGDCTCGCTVAAPFTCSETVTFNQGGGGCNGGSSTFDAGSEGGCLPAPMWTGDGHNQLLPAATTLAGGGCDASGPTGATSSTSAVTSCAPACSADYCHVPNGYERCVISLTETTCPVGFQPPASLTSPVGQMGAGSSASVACNGCSCTTPTGACGATITAYGTNDCTGPAYEGGIAFEAGCTDYHEVVKSVAFLPTAPDAACMSSGGGVASVAFNPAITVCCLP